MRFAAVFLVLCLSACGLDVNTSLPYKILPGSIERVPELDGVRVTVGSKDFTENIILGYLAEMALSAAGADVVDLTDLKGAQSARQALINGEVDVTWEYTGTGWINYQGNERPVPGGQEAQYEATRKADEERFGITWLAYSPLNDQFAFAVTEERGQQLGLKTLSDLTKVLQQQPAEAVFCLDTEFASRLDGFPAAVKTYGFPVTETKNFAVGAIYSAVASGTCPIGEVYSTDGRIAAQRLRVLDDDLQAFPHYNVSPTLRSEFLARHPQLRGPLETVSKALTNDQMIELCRQVDVEGRDAGAVARDWMVAKGFITAS